jgi:hypothetical protein
MIAPRAIREGSVLLRSSLAQRFYKGCIQRWIYVSQAFMRVSMGALPRSGLGYANESRCAGRLTLDYFDLEWQYSH